MPDAVPRLPVAAGCHSGRGGPGGPRLAALVPVALRSRPPTARIDFSSFGAVPGLGSGSQSRDSESHGGRERTRAASDQATVVRFQVRRGCWQYHVTDL